MKELKKKLMHDKKNAWKEISEVEKKRIFKFSDGYKTFLDEAKTERESVSFIRKYALENGYKEIEKASKKDKKLFLSFDDAAAMMVNINDTAFKDGFLMVGAHIDTPRIDLKANPLYEDMEMAFMKTHYYGGIKKYQWVTRPLALHGCVIFEDGKRQDVVIGEDENDPVFTINDLLPHLAQDQIKKNAAKVVEGEQLNILVGSIPYKFKDEKDAIKIAILEHLHKKYGIKEEDFISSEMQLVPAGKARDVGFDRSFVGSHGQDDRVCSYAGMKALSDMAKSNRNAAMLFFDKEEIGSKGNTGANSNIMERAVMKILSLYGKGDYSTVLSNLENTKFLSSDVNAAVDPCWKGVHEEMNAGVTGSGVCLTKFTGVKGKANSNEAHAEFVAECRRAFNKDKVRWQTAEMGKVDQGGGGTIAMFIAEYGMDVIDCGTPILSMHSPFEIASKADIYHTYKAYLAFFKHM